LKEHCGVPPETGTPFLGTASLRSGCYWHRVGGELPSSSTIFMAWLPTLLAYRVDASSISLSQAIPLKHVHNVAVGSYIE
jgi:hypothetical protein